MRRHILARIVAVAIAFALAVIVFVVFITFGFLKLLLLIGVLAAILILGGMVIMAINARYCPPEIVKQIIVWLGIVVLLPFSVWYGTSTFTKAPDWKEHSRASARLDARILDATEAADREKLRDEKDELDADLHRAEQHFYSRMFWVAYPIGLVAVVAGILLGVQAVGGGLLYGGIASLVMGCFTYWDNMNDGLRFGALLLTLAVLITMGIWRFGPLQLASLFRPGSAGAAPVSGRERNIPGAAA
jgi:hypothetical protein